MSWVLIIALYASASYPVSLATAYFNTEKQCISAAEQFKNKFNPENGWCKVGRSVEYVCVNNQTTKIGD